VISSQQQQIHRTHQDIITALALLDSPFRGCIISGDRSGTIKVFRVDQD
jgi:phosphoinositide-3-kinase regulatory subunit 4